MKTSTSIIIALLSGLMAPYIKSQVTFDQNFYTSSAQVQITNESNGITISLTTPSSPDFVWVLSDNLQITPTTVKKYFITPLTASGSVDFGVSESVDTFCSFPSQYYVSGGDFTYLFLDNTVSCYTGYQCGFYPSVPSQANHNPYASVLGQTYEYDITVSQNIGNSVNVKSEN